MKKQKGAVLVIVLVSIAIIMIMLIYGVIIGMPQFKETYTLRSFKNTVALYSDGKIIEIYDNIVLDTLPEGDRARLNSGIEFSTISDAQKQIEDYDG